VRGGHFCPLPCECGAGALARGFRRGHNIIHAVVLRKRRTRQRRISALGLQRVPQVSRFSRPGRTDDSSNRVRSGSDSGHPLLPADCFFDLRRLDAIFGSKIAYGFASSEPGSDDRSRDPCTCDHWFAETNRRIDLIRLGSHCGATPIYDGLFAFSKTENSIRPGGRFTFTANAPFSVTAPFLSVKLN
jgi:hypothetical protein